MQTPKNYNIGIMFRREYPPESLPDFARQAEASGFDELWVVEDCLYTGGIASAAVALASTRTIKVGLGIMPAPVRNPVFAAMEIATLARIYPGRFIPGFGHGVTDWMRQVGALPTSQLKALEEVAVCVRRLLDGEHFSFHGTHVQLDQVQLVHPPQHIPPLIFGVIGPKSLTLSGRLADGTLLSEYGSAEYVRWAKAQIAAGHPDTIAEHNLTLFAYAYACSNLAEADQKLRPMFAEALASKELDPKLLAMGILPEVQQYRQSGSQIALEASMPRSWIEHMAIAGSPQDWTAAIARYVESGVHSVVLVPLPDTGPNEIKAFARHLKRF